MEPADVDLLADLTPNQREAVLHVEGPLLILAGAGSGKTRVITRRVAHLLQQGIRPTNILAITFTNKAAGEMRTRIESLVPGSPVWISTFHSLGAKLLRIYHDRLGLDRHFTIFDQTDRARMVKLAMEDAGLDESRYKPDTLSGAISKAKNQLLSPEKFANQAKDFFAQTVARVYPCYEKRMRDANALDFDDLLYWPALAIKNDAELRAELDARFRYVMVDEYQDTNMAQYAIVRGISKDHPNLCVVGDPDQCLPPGTIIETPRGPRPIETLKDGDEVLSGIGWGDVRSLPTNKVMVNPFKGRLVKIHVEGGITVRATPNHLCFGSIETSPKEFGDVISRARLTRRTTFPFLPASHIQPGMRVPVLIDGEIVDRQVLSVEWEDYEGPVYDLSVPQTHNYVANGMVVHNSIYKFRGSDIRNILDFERDFPDARVLTLTQNYRSTQAILAASSALIANNRNRKPKSLITENAVGSAVTILMFESGVEEAEGIALRIRKAVEESKGSRNYRDFAVFLRINALTRGLELAFTKHRVPFQIVKGLAFFDRKENRDVLAYLQLLINPRNDIAFERVVNEPTRGIGKVSLENLRLHAGPRELSMLEAASQADQILLLKGKAATSLRAFAQMMFDLSKLRDTPPEEVIRQVLDRSGYRKALLESRDEGDQDRLANIEELITAAREFSREDNTRTISDFVENITLASDVDSWDQKQDCVSVMTMHSAKGLEFPVVYLVAVEQGLLPHERSLGKDEEIEEERRLAFVGMTRAKEELYLTHARLRDFRGQTLYAVPSMFLEELPRDQIERIDLAMGAGRNSSFDEWRGGGGASAAPGWTDAGVRPRPEPIKPSALGLSGSVACPYTVGMQVRHATYGDGRVVEVSGQGVLRKVKIRFRTAGERAFIVDKVKLDIIGPS
jgi:DNA helicase-2/ATP-dependent DNA helicase PcrA